MRFIILFFSVGMLSSCWLFTGKGSGVNDLSIKVIGWKPVYASDTSSKKIKYFATPRPTTKAGKIYVFGNTIFQNDVGQGIHIINNTNPATAAKTAFIEIKGNTDLSIKGNFLYANNFMDVVVIDISNISTPIEVKRVKNAFSAQTNYPWVMPPQTGYYECPKFYNDSVIVEWKRDSVPQFCNNF